MQKVHLVSLGCPKNRVDSEVMVGLLQEGEGYDLVPDPDDADVIIFNTKINRPIDTAITIKDCSLKA